MQTRTLTILNTASTIMREKGVDDITVFKKLLTNLKEEDKTSQKHIENFIKGSGTVLTDILGGWVVSKDPSCYDENLAKMFETVLEKESPENVYEGITNVWGKRTIDCKISDVSGNGNKCQTIKQIVGVLSFFRVEIDEGSLDCIIALVEQHFTTTVAKDCRRYLLSKKINCYSDITKSLEEVRVDQECVFPIDFTRSIVVAVVGGVLTGLFTKLDQPWYPSYLNPYFTIYHTMGFKVNNGTRQLMFSNIGGETGEDSRWLAALYKHTVDVDLVDKYINACIDSVVDSKTSTVTIPSSKTSTLSFDKNVSSVLTYLGYDREGAAPQAVATALGKVFGEEARKVGSHGMDFERVVEPNHSQADFHSAYMFNKLLTQLLDEEAYKELGITQTSLEVFVDWKHSKHAFSLDPTTLSGVKNLITCVLIILQSYGELNRKNIITFVKKCDLNTLVTRALKLDSPVTTHELNALSITVDFFKGVLTDVALMGNLYYLSLDTNTINFVSVNKFVVSFIHSLSVDEFEDANKKVDVVLLSGLFKTLKYAKERFAVDVREIIMRAAKVAYGAGVYEHLLNLYKGSSDASHVDNVLNRHVEKSLPLTEVWEYVEAYKCLKHLGTIGADYHIPKSLIERHALEMGLATIDDYDYIRVCLSSTMRVVDQYNLGGNTFVFKYLVREGLVGKFIPRDERGKVVQRLIENVLNDNRFADPRVWKTYHTTSLPEEQMQAVRYLVADYERVHDKNYYLKHLLGLDTDSKLYQLLNRIPESENRVKVANTLLHLYEHREYYNVLENLQFLKSVAFKNCRRNPVVFEIFSSGHYKDYAKTIARTLAKVDERDMVSKKPFDEITDYTEKLEELNNLRKKFIY